MSIRLGKMRDIIRQIALLSLLASLVTGCGVYAAGFNCPDSKGARCVMLSRVDQMIDSGEIAEVYQQRTKNCRKGMCNSQLNLPKKPLEQVQQVKIEQGAGLDQWQDNDSLYLQ